MEVTDFMTEMISTSPTNHLEPLRVLRLNPFLWASLLLYSVVTARPLMVYLNSINEFNVSIYQVAEFSELFFIKLFPALLFTKSKH